MLDELGTDFDPEVFDRIAARFDTEFVGPMRSSTAGQAARPNPAHPWNSPRRLSKTGRGRDNPQWHRDRLTQRLETGWVPAALLAEDHAGAGDSQRALEWLAVARDEAASCCCTSAAARPSRT